jgi:hypothetical protein
MSVIRTLGSFNVKRSNHFDFGVLVFELRASYLARQALYHLSHSANPILTLGETKSIFIETEENKQIPRLIDIHIL